MQKFVVFRALTKLVEPAKQDAVVLGQHLKRAMTARESDPKEGLAGVETAELTSVLREYEDQRMRRVFPVQLKSYVAGAVAQLAFPPVSTSLRFACCNS